MLRKWFLVSAMFLASFILFYGYNFWQNNKGMEWPSRSELKAAHDKAVQWLVDHREQIEKIRNPALWWMIKESSDISANQRLDEIFDHYNTHHLKKRPPDIWTPYFRKGYRAAAPSIYLLDDFDDYQLFFVYALSCDKEYEAEPIIQAQLDSAFCEMHFLHPRCVTHQMMGVRLMQERHCGEPAKLPALVSELQAILITELTWDFRVGDAYLQRALMLAQSEAIDSIKAVWIHRILEAQNEDGGWDDLHPLIAFSENSVLGFTSTLPTVGRPRSNFHATAQGVWLLSLLLADRQER